MSDSRPARFGYSIVAAAFGVQALSIGFSITAFPIFIESLETELQATRTQTSFGVPLVVMAGALIGPWAGRVVDRGSPRAVMILGALAMLLGLAAVSAAPSLLWAAAAWVLLVGPGHMLMGPLPAMTVIANWFVARRTTMIAVAAMGTTFGGALVPPLGEWLIQGVGWRGTSLAMGLLCAGIGIPLVWLGIRKSPEEVGLHPDGAAEPAASAPAAAASGSVRDILGEPRFWLVACTFAAQTGIGIAFLTHTLPFASERGLPRELAVALLSINALCSAAGKLGFGLLTDRWGPRRAIQLGLALQVVGWVGLLASTGPVAFTASGACFSLGAGSMMPCQAGFVAALFGRERFGQASGLIGMVTVLGMFSVAPLIGAGYDATGSYDLPFAVALALIALALVCIGFVRLHGPTRSTADAPVGSPARSPR